MKYEAFRFSVRFSGIYGGLLSGQCAFGEPVQFYDRLCWNVIDECVDTTIVGPPCIEATPTV